MLIIIIIVLHLLRIQLPLNVKKINCFCWSRRHQNNNLELGQCNFYKYFYWLIYALEYFPIEFSLKTTKCLFVNKFSSPDNYFQWKYFSFWYFSSWKFTHANNFWCSFAEEEAKTNAKKNTRKIFEWITGKSWEEMHAQHTNYKLSNVEKKENSEIKLNLFAL